MWTPAEAQAALPQVRELLTEGRKHLSAARDAQTQLDDLRIIWGDQVMAVACPGNAEWLDWASRYERARKGLFDVLLRFGKLGVEVKDVEEGLVDFRGRVGTADAYICWKWPEERIEWWHPLEGGFAARRRLP